MDASVQTSLADLASHIPAASRVFRRYGLDFCCAGRRSLASACAELGLDPALVLSEVDRERTPGTVPAAELATRSTATLVQYIVEHYHEPLRAELERVIEMAAKVERAHARKDRCPHGLTALLQAMKIELEDHMDKEELILFPLLVRGAGSTAWGPIAVLTQEHDDHGARLQEIRALTDSFTPPKGACPTWRALYLALDELEQALMEHVHLENHILFPRALGNPH